MILVYYNLFFNIFSFTKYLQKMTSRVEVEMPVDLMELGVQHLLQMKTQVEQELAVFQNAFAKLKLAQSKLQESMECVEKISARDEGRKLLVPLTSSLFVEGRMVEPDKLLIDVGAGYFVEMDQKSAVDYFRRKLAFVKAEEEKLQDIGREKSKAREVISEVLQLKLQQLTTNTEHCNQL